MIVMIHDPSESQPDRASGSRAEADRRERSTDCRRFLPDPLEWDAPDTEAVLEAGPARVVDLNAGYFSGVPEGRRRGEALILTESLPMVLEARRHLLDRDYNLTWTNNFWLAMSYLRERSFCALVVDARSESLEERYLAQFLEEYDERSRGRKVIVAGECLSSGVQRQVRSRGHRLVDAHTEVLDLIDALGLRDLAREDE